MSKKNVIVSNVSEGHDNPIAELVQVACQFDSDIMLESVTEGADEEAALDAIEKFLVCE